ncbi:MAG TPA: hypothetical protein VMB79_16270 [Jatrophihabitans sp.]|nr:hypothetical protein [Jatrophihabitans sp.]
MSMFDLTGAASDIAAAFRVRRAGVEVIGAAPAVGSAGTGLANVVFGKGHPPRGIPL